MALPDIQRSLHASAAAIEWLVSGYALTSASLLVCGGRLGDHYGRRRCFCIGLAAFVLASALCAVAPDPGFLIAARLVQGAGGAIMAPNIMSILGMTYTGRDRVRAISVYGMVMGIAAVGGQLIGGVLIDANVAGLGWRAIFWVNVPIGLVALAAAWRLVPESRAERAGHLDLPGAALLAAGLVAIVLPLADGRQQGWPAWSWACLALGPVLLALFAGYLRRAGRPGRQPLLDPAVFAVRTLRVGLTVQALFWCQQAASYLLLALFLQQGRGLGALESGGVFAVLAAGYLLTSLRAPALTVRFGRRVIATGAALRRRRRPAAGARRRALGGRRPAGRAVPRAVPARRGPGAVHHPADHHGAVARGRAHGRVHQRGAVHRPAGRQRDRRRGERGHLLRPAEPRVPGRLRHQHGADGRSAAGGRGAHADPAPPVVRDRERLILRSWRRC